MARVRVKASVKNEVSKTVLRKINELWRDAVREFVFTFIEAASSRAGSYPPYIDTGMSMASLVPVSSFVGSNLRIGLGQFVQDAIRVNKAVAQSANPTKGSGGPPRGVSKPGRSVAEGQRQGEAAFDLTFGSTSLPQFVFAFKLVIFQMTASDKNSKFFEGVLEDSRRAFRGYIRSNLKKYLKPSDIKKLILRG